MKLTDGERLIVVMLAEVMEEMGLNREIDPALVKAPGVQSRRMGAYVAVSGYLRG